MYFQNKPGLKRVRHAEDRNPISRAVTYVSEIQVRLIDIMSFSHAGRMSDLFNGEILIMLQSFSSSYLKATGVLFSASNGFTEKRHLG